MLLISVSTLFVVWLLSVRGAGIPQSPVVRPNANTKRFCKPGECCEFKLRVYQRCVGEDQNDTRSLQTWPLFYDFVDKRRRPIAPVTRDYNKKACSRKDCGVNSIGHILGPGDFYMRWQMQEDVPRIPVGMESGRFTYWFGGDDHAETERCSANRWSGYDGENWSEVCSSKTSTNMLNRTRMRETVCPFEC